MRRFHDGENVKFRAYDVLLDRGRLVCYKIRIPYVPILQPAEMRGRFEFVAMNFSFGQGLVTVFGWSGFQSFNAKILFRIGRTRRFR